MLRLFCDTDCDVTPEIAAEYDYTMISMPYTIGDTTVFPYVDFDVFESHAFYQQLREGALPTTAAINEAKYIEYFEPVFAAGDDILYVHFSRAMSATFENMDRAVAALKEKYPERKIYTIDTKGITLVSCNIAIEVGRMYKAGKSVEEMLEWAKTEVDKYAVYFFADDLKFFRHSGRVSGLAATMGTLLGVRPIIYMDGEGKMVSIGKERGRQKAIDRLIAYVDELGEDVADHRVIIGSTDAPDVAGEIADAIRAKYGDNTEILILDVNPTAGSHCGPDTVGISFYAKHR